MRRPSTLARAIRAMTAVITVWCIGCSGFEPLLDAAFGDGAVGMTCGSDRIETSAHAMDSAHALATVSAAGVHQRAFDCGCGSCHSAAPSVWSYRPTRALAPMTAFSHAGMLASIVRTPLLPPPQHTA